MKKATGLLFLAGLMVSVWTSIGCSDTKITKSTIAVLETTQGTIELKFFPEIAPKAVENFVEHIQKGYYDGILFHRVIKGFMIQGGDPTGTGRGGESIWGGEFEDEVKSDVVFDREGVLAMANHGPDTNGSQFFITVGPQPSLNGNYTIFGEVYSGMDVVHKIEMVATSGSDRPVEEQKIIKATVRDYLK